MLKEFDIVAFFRKALSVGDVLETAERKQVVRSLRKVYFYPDGALPLMDKLVRSDGRDVEAIAGLYDLFGQTQKSVEEAIDFITSESVQTNLQIPMEIVDGLREAANQKMGIRGIFTSMHFTLVFSQDYGAIVDSATFAKAEIEKLNEQLKSLEKAMN